MKKYIFFIFILISGWGFSQPKFSLSGTISDAQNGEKLLGVNFIIKNTSTGVTTNEYGFYSISLPQGVYEIQVEYLGYESISEKINLTQNIRRDFKLSPQAIELSGVEVSGQSPKANIKKPEMSVVSLPVSTIKKMPVLIGEVDIVKSLMQLPGVSNAGEASSGFNVRGGASDQNLILLDEAAIFNASHLFGFLSVFNADAIKDLKLYKGGIPARYGGRIASVLDIYQKEGNKNNYSLSGGIGALSSRILAEGPIVKEKSSFLIGGRASYAHLFLKFTDNQNSGYFYDLNTKLSYELNKNNSLYLSGYFGRDFFDLDGILKNIYGNSLINLRWNHLFSEKLFSNLSLIYSDYYYSFRLNSAKFQWDSGIKNFNLKYDFRHYLSDKHKLSYGVQGIYYQFNPGKLYPSEEDSKVKIKQLANKYALETGFYLDNEFQISENINASVGFRQSYFFHLGERNVNLYPDDNPVAFNHLTQVYYKAQPTGQKHYSSGEIINLYHHFEPRATISYAFSPTKSVKASYMRTAQYLHLISNTSSPTPLDIWTPSNSYIQPQTAHQWALGYASNLKDDLFSVEVETYYKAGNNRLDYIDGADLIANEYLEQVVLPSQTRAYGVEFLLRKNHGNFTGWIAYTLSKSEQQTLPRSPNETGINQGEWYATPYDKPHDLSVVTTYNLSKKWSLGASFTLQTGIPANFPVNKYQYSGITIANYGKRNAFRLPMYHRLDVSATYTPQKPDRKFKSDWNFGIYNVYNRYNATSIFFRRNKDTDQNEAVKLSIFGIVPSVTYNFYF